MQANCYNGYSLMLCPAWILDWNWNVIIMQKHIFLLLITTTTTSLSLFLTINIPEVLKMYVSVRGNTLDRGQKRWRGWKKREARKRVRRSNEKCWTVASQQARVQTLPPALQNYSYYLTSFLLKISIVMPFG